MLKHLDGILEGDPPKLEYLDMLLDPNSDDNRPALNMRSRVTMMDKLSAGIDLLSKEKKTNEIPK